MSTKNISRSALEGGRNTSNKFDRNESHRRERNHFRTWVNHVIADDEFADANPIPERPPVHKGFTDKLNPCYRWLASKCGQPWSTVFSELKAKFDTRNLASWHIVNQHILTSILGAGVENDGEVGFYRGHRFFIDDEGILRDRGENHLRWVKPKQPVDETLAARAMAHANGRRVRDSYGEALYWATLSPEPRWMPCKRMNWVPGGRRCGRSELEHRQVETTSPVLVQMYGQPGNKALGAGDWWRTFTVEHFETEAWRLKDRLSKADVQWWRSLPWQIQSRLTVGI